MKKLKRFKKLKPDQLKRYEGVAPCWAVIPPTDGYPPRKPGQKRSPSYWRAFSTDLTPRLKKIIPPPSK